MRTDTTIKVAIRLVAFVATVAFIYHLSSVLLFASARYDDTGIDQVSDSVDSGFGIGAYIWKGNQEDTEEDMPDDGGASEEEQENEGNDAEATEGDEEAAGEDEAGQDAAENEDGVEEAIVDEDIEDSGLSEEEEALRQSHEQDAEETIETIAEHPKKNDRHRLSHVITDELRHKQQEAESFVNEDVAEDGLSEEEEALKQDHQGNTDEMIEVIAEHSDDPEQYS